MFPRSSTNINEIYEIQFSSHSLTLIIIDIILTCYVVWQKNMTGYQGISWPSQAKNLPLSWLFTLLMMFSSFWTENSLLKSLSLGTFLWNGLERSVSTVPGCNKMHTMGSFFLANSNETVFDTVQMGGAKNKLVVIYIYRKTF